MTLFLPNNFPPRQIAECYIFGHNKTHMALDLDYGSIINHHESANARAKVAGVHNSMHYWVRGFYCENRVCIHNSKTYT